MPFSLRCVAFAALLSAAVYAQEERDPSRVIGETVERQLLLEIETRLASEQLETVAWGGWLAAKHGVKTAVPALRKSLARLVDLPLARSRYAALSVLDALRCNGARLSRQELAPFTSGTLEPLAYVLAAENAEQHRDFLFEKFVKADKSRRQTRWLASGQLLAAMKDRGFARRLVRSLRYRLELEVTDKDSLIGGGIGGAFGARFGDGRLTVPSGYPPIALYHLTVKPKRGDVLLTPGKHPVYWRRVVHEQRKIGVGGSEGMPSHNRQPMRVAWICNMLSAGFRLPPVEHEWVDFEKGEDLVAKATAMRQSIVGQHDMMVAKAVEKGWFEPDERAELRARVKVVVKDVRGDKSVPLPVVD